MRQQDLIGSVTGLTAGEVITFDLYFFLDTGLGPSHFQLNLADALGNFISSQPAGFSTNNAITFNTTMTYTWTVATSGDYILTCLSAGSFQSLIPYYINITSGSNGNVIAPRVGILRPSHLYNPIYICNAADVVITCTACSLFKLLNNPVPASFDLGGTVSSSSSTSNSKTYTALAAGYYIV